jgi:hypothetical protein
MEAGRTVVPYVPFKTFLTALEALEQDLPNQLDRSLWPSYSGAIQGQLLGAFRFLGLMDDGNCPTPALREMLGKRESRRDLLRALLERHYAPLVGLDLPRTSPRQLDEAMRQYGLSGATHKKAISFFLQAAQYAGLPLSVLLKAKTRTAAFGRRRPGAPAPAGKGGETPPSSVSKTVVLRTGGTLTVTASLDLFSLGAEDRKFVFDLIDRLQEYEGG